MRRTIVLAGIAGVLGLGPAVAATRGAPATTRVATAATTTTTGLARGLERVHRDLLTGDSRARQAALQQLTGSTLDESMLDALEAAATDPDASVRAEVARTGLGPLVWSARQQSPRAIALALKLAEDPSPGVVHNAIYYGLSTVRAPSDEVIRAMLKVAARGRMYEEAGTHWRIAWGLKDVSKVPPQRLLPFFEEYWAKADAAPKPAFLLVRLYKEATGQDPPNARRFAGLADRVAELDEQHRRGVIAANANLIDDLAHGDSATRLKALRQIYRTEDLLSSLDLAHLDALITAAGDNDPQVRRHVANVVGGRWVYSKDPSPRATELLIRLAHDPVAEVRYDAIYGGLSNVPQKTDDVIRAMIDAALAYGAYENNLYGRIAWSLNYRPKPDPARIDAVFAPYLADADATRARLAAVLYINVTNKIPPDADRATADLLLVVPFSVAKADRREPAELLERFTSLIPADAYSEVFIASPDGGFAITKGAAAQRRLAELIRRTPPLNPGGFAGGPAGSVIEPPTLDYIRRQYRTRAVSPARAAEAQVEAKYAETFRQLYDHLGRVYPAFEIKKIDWKKVGDQLLPRAKDVKDDEQFGRLCLELVARLEDSHAQLLPGTAAIPGIDFPQFDPGFACLIDDRDRPVVYHVDQDSPAAKAGVKVGATVVSVNGKPAADAIKAWMDHARTYVGYSSDRYLRYDAAKGFHRAMKQGEVVKVEMEDPDGAKHTFEMPAALGGRYVPRLPVPIDGIRDDGGVMAKDLGDGIGYIYVRRIRGDLPGDLDAALKQLGDIKGLIIDVRGNSGGGFDAGRSFRNFDPDDKAEPDRPRYAGPIALLIDERCISAGEGWASWFFATRRARSFGTTTAGASSRKAEYTLGNGTYKVIVPVKAYTGSLDRPIERRGLEPDVAVRQRAADLAANRDTVLETAKQWLRGQEKG